MDINETRWNYVLERMKQIRVYCTSKKMLTELVRFYNKEINSILEELSPNAVKAVTELRRVEKELGIDYTLTDCLNEKIKKRNEKLWKNRTIPLSENSKL